MMLQNRESMEEYPYRYILNAHYIKVEQADLLGWTINWIRHAIQSGWNRAVITPSNRSNFLKDNWADVESLFLGWIRSRRGILTPYQLTIEYFLIVSCNPVFETYLNTTFQTLTISPWPISMARFTNGAGKNSTFSGSLWIIRGRSCSQNCGLVDIDFKKKNYAVYYPELTLLLILIFHFIASYEKVSFIILSNAQKYVYQRLIYNPVAPMPSFIW